MKNRFNRFFFLKNALTMMIFNKKVDFVIVGAMKSGTTTLHASLSNHPEITMASVKETHFFSKPLKPWSKPLNYINYHQFFSIKNKYSHVGETTPYYIFHQTAIENIHDYNPNMKIIAILRNPITRAFSHWNMSRVRGKNTMGFIDSVENEPVLSIDNKQKYSFVARGYYCEQILNIYKYFPKYQTLIIKYDDFILDAAKTLEHICSFLDVRSFRFQTNEWCNKGSYSDTMNESDFNYMRTIFTTEIKKLEDLLSWDCRNWLDYSTVFFNGVLL